MELETKVNLIYWVRKIGKPILIILCLPFIPFWGIWLIFSAFMEEDDREFCQDFKYDYPWDKDHPHRIVKQWRKLERLKEKAAKKLKREEKRNREKESIRIDLELKQLKDVQTKEDAVEFLKKMNRKLELDIENLKEI
jgi:beta-phosphoglucomutase-like phosphatase (HAD superfamily)